jgi:hypothetical protein
LSPALLALYLTSNCSRSVPDAFIFSISTHAPSCFLGPGSQYSVTPFHHPTLSENGIKIRTEFDGKSLEMCLANRLKLVSLSILANKPRFAKSEPKTSAAAAVKMWLPGSNDFGFLATINSQHRKWQKEAVNSSSYVHKLPSAFDMQSFIYSNQTHKDQQFSTVLTRYQYLVLTDF